MEVDENRRHKSEEKHIRQNKDRLRVLESCEDLVHSVFTIGMDHINNLMVKGLWVLLHYHFGSERLTVSPNKVELVESVTYLF